MKGPILPNELLASILAHLDNSEFASMDTLRQCSYTSRTLRVESQKLLFRAIYFYEYDTSHHSPIDIGSPSSWRRFFELIEILPHVVDYVEVFRTSSNSLFMDNAEKYIPMILSRFKKLNEFSILKEDDLASWHTIPKTIQNTILDVLQSPSLVDVSFLIYSVPRMHFHTFPPSVKRLTLSLVSLDEIALAFLKLENKDKPRSFGTLHFQDSQVMLEDLSIEYLQQNAHTLWWLVSPISPFNFSQLKSLTLRLIPDTMVDTGYVDLLLGVVSESLEHLTLALHVGHMQRHLQPDQSYLVAPLNLAAFPRLRTLTLEVPVRCAVGNEDYLDPIPWITRLLETSALGLKTIRFDFSFHRLSDNHLKEMQWDRIRKILLEDFPGRPTIKFRASGLLVTQKAILQASKGMNELTSGEIIFAQRPWGTVSTHLPW